MTYPNSGKISMNLGRSAAIAMMALLSVFTSPPAVADQGKVSLVKDREFAKVRSELIKAGWEPVISDATMNNGMPENRFGAAGPMYDAGFVEVEFCSEGSVYCLFNYTRAGKCLQITTRGEYGKHNGRQYPLVQKWSSDCRGTR